jgi:hypothetical protein
MNVKYRQETRKYPQSWGMAVVNESFDATQGPKARNRSLAPVNPLGPAKGIILGFGLSIMLWSVIILVTSWIL